VAIIGAGPAGLMAAETLLKAGLQVDIYDAMPSAGRKFLVAGKGGLNLTHSEPFDQFLSHYGDRSAQMEPFLRLFGPEDIQGLSCRNEIGSPSPPVAGTSAPFWGGFSFPSQMDRLE